MAVNRIKFYKTADGRTIRGLILAETKKGGTKVLSKEELKELKIIARERGIKITPKKKGVCFPKFKF
jgi:ribosomal protein L27